MPPGSRRFGGSADEVICASAALAERVPSGQYALKRNPAGDGNVYET